MSYVLIIHEVGDDAAWKTVFDDAATIRKQDGERSYQVLNYENDPNKIIHVLAWTSTRNARAFLSHRSWWKFVNKLG